MSKYKEDIIRLRKQRKSYREIENDLGCSRGTVAYHCQNEGLEDIGMKTKEISDEKKKAIRETYKNETAEKTAEIHDVGITTVKKYGRSKNSKRSTGELKNNTDKKNKDKTGDISEQKIKLKLIEEGYTVSEPINSGSRYDLVADDQKSLYKVQVKTAYNEDKSTSIFQCCSIPRSRERVVPYKKEEIDVFCVYSRMKNEIYWIDFDEVRANTKMTLRHKKPKKGGKTKRINWSSDYKI